MNRFAYSVTDFPCIEDIQDPMNLASFACFENVTVYDLRPKKGRYDDLLVMIQKRP